MKQTKKLIEVALPLEDINKASAREKSIRHGHPSTLHLWWARRPLAAARAVIFAQMVDDPSSHPELFPTVKEQDHERQRLFKLIMELVKWENITNEEVLNQAREEIRKSWRLTCDANNDHPQAKDLYNPEKLPDFHDPFAGGGGIPLEAQRLGLESYASDLNPVAVLINKAMIEIPPKFVGRTPVNPESRKQGSIVSENWPGSSGLVEDIRYYGSWMRNEAEKQIGHLYPKVRITRDMVYEDSDLKSYLGSELSIIAWIWVRTVKSPNPAFSNVDVPLASTFMLSSKKNKEKYIEPLIENGGYSFKVKKGKPQNSEKTKNGTKISRSNFSCIMSGTPITGEYIKEEGKAGRLGAKLLATIVQGKGSRFYLSPTEKMNAIGLEAKPKWKPEIMISGSSQYIGVRAFGMERFSQLFTDRQLLALTTFSELIKEVRKQIKSDAARMRLSEEIIPSDNGGKNATAYADTVAIYLSFALSKVADRGSSLTRWMPSRDSMYNTFGRHALSMSWDYVEVNPIGQQTGGFAESLRWTVEALEGTASVRKGKAFLQSATNLNRESFAVFSTDPPYYDNVPYADLSDFFYVWLRCSLKDVFPEIFGTVAVPKDEELVAFAYRHNNKKEAEEFFLNGMSKTMERISVNSHPSFPITIYYAFKQFENIAEERTSSTGWETFLEAVIGAGLSITGTWPMRTELANRMRGMGSNALASSIVLVCNKLEENALKVTRREFVSSLKRELPKALSDLQRGNIAPVDLPQSSIGPGMAIFSRYKQVLEDDGSKMSVRTALQIINQALDEFLSEQESQMDSWTRFTITWFSQFGFEEGPFGKAQELSRARDIGLNTLTDFGLMTMGGGKVQLLRPSEFREIPNEFNNLTVWEVTHRLIHALAILGEEGAANLLREFGSVGDSSLELAYRLYDISEKNKWTEEAIGYNTMVVAWAEICKLAMKAPTGKTVQDDLFE